MTAETASKVEVIVDKEDVVTALTVTVPADRCHDFTPGSYYFLNIPSISSVEWHPISLSEQQECKLTFHVKSMADGAWSHKLSALAHAHANTKANLLPTVAMDGPFGCLSVDLTRYSSLCLFCGGIGVTPLLPTLEHVLRLKSAGGLPRLTKVTFCWSVRGTGLLTSDAFHSRLVSAIKCSRDMIHSTSPAARSSDSKNASAAVSPTSSGEPTFALEMVIHNTGGDTYKPPATTTNASTNTTAVVAVPESPPEEGKSKGKNHKGHKKHHQEVVEGVSAHNPPQDASLSVQSGRPALGSIISAAAEVAAKSKGLTCALVCGPAGLAKGVMDAAGVHNNVHVHQETFGY